MADKNERMVEEIEKLFELNHTHEELESDEAMSGEALLRELESREDISEEELLHELEHEYGIPHSHNHDHEHGHGHYHGHTHSHTQTKAVINRLSKAIGHLSAVKRMVETGRDCSEVLIQLAAVRAAINNTGKIILKDHIEHCIIEAVSEGDKEAVDMLSAAIDRFMN